MGERLKLKFSKAFFQKNFPTLLLEDSKVKYLKNDTDAQHQEKSEQLYELSFGGDFPNSMKIGMVQKALDFLVEYPNEPKIELLRCILMNRMDDLYSESEADYNEESAKLVKKMYELSGNLIGKLDAFGKPRLFVYFMKHILYSTLTPKSKGENMRELFASLGESKDEMDQMVKLSVIGRMLTILLKFFVNTKDIKEAKILFDATIEKNPFLPVFQRIQKKTLDEGSSFLQFEVPYFHLKYQEQCVLTYLDFAENCTQMNAMVKKQIAAGMVPPPNSGLDEETLNKLYGGHLTNATYLTKEVMELLKKERTDYDISLRFQMLELRLLFAQAKHDEVLEKMDKLLVSLLRRYGLNSGIVGKAFYMKSRALEEGGEEKDVYSKFMFMAFSIMNSIPGGETLQTEIDTYRKGLMEDFSLRKREMDEVLSKYVIKCSSQNCHSMLPNMKRCSRCKVASYCSKICQKKDWKLFHKKKCKEWKEFTKLDGFYEIYEEAGKDEEDKMEIVKPKDENRKDQEKVKENLIEAEKDIVEKYSVEKTSINKGVLFEELSEITA